MAPATTLGMLARYLPTDRATDYWLVNIYLDLKILGSKMMCLLPGGIGGY